MLLCCVVAAQSTMFISIQSADAYSGSRKVLPYDPPKIEPIEMPFDGDISLPYYPVIDDGDRNFRSKGKWITVPFAGFKNDFRFAYPNSTGKNAYATWEFKKMSAGKYEIYTTWDAFPGLSRNAPFSVEYDAASLTFVDQTKTPQGLRYLGRNWQKLDTVTINSSNSRNRIKVMLNAATSGYVVADAVILKRVNGGGADVMARMNGPQSAQRGQNIEFGFGVSNNGPEVARDARLTMIYDATVFTPDNDRWNQHNCIASHSPIFEYEANDAVMKMSSQMPRRNELGIVQCNLGTINPNNGDGFDLPFKVKEDAPCESTFAEAFIKSETRDPNMSNNGANTEIAIRCDQPLGANLSLNMIYDDRLEQGEKLSYKIRLENGGPSMAHNSRVYIENLDPNLHYDPYASSPGCILAEGGSFFECDFGNMSDNEVKEKTIKFNIADNTNCGYGISNIFTAQSSTFDPNQGNNTIGTQVIVECEEEEPMLNISMEHIGISDTALPGQKNINLLRLKAKAGETEDILLKSFIFGEDSNPHNLKNIENYTLWVDADSSGQIDTILQRGVSVEDFSRIYFDDLVGGGFIVPAGNSTLFEVHGDVKQETVSDTVQITLGTAAPNYVKAEELDTGVPLSGIETNGTCYQNECDISVFTVPSIIWRIVAYIEEAVEDEAIEEVAEPSGNLLHWVKKMTLRRPSRR